MKNLTIFLSLPVLLLAFNNCSQTEFQNSAQSIYDVHENGLEVPEEEIEDIPYTTDNECSSGSVCLVIRDNFERNNILGSGFAWSTFLDDKGRNLTNLDVSISSAAPASYGQSAVYFTGRSGGSVHSLYLISKPFNLTGFSRVTIEFDYLMASFESYSYNGVSGKEHLKVDICSLGSAACGLGVAQATAANRLKDSNRWSNIFSRVANSPINQQFNGSNHSKSDFTRVRANQISIDLNNSNINKSNVMLRWNVLIDEGLLAGNPDAGIIDNIIVRAYK